MALGQCGATVLVATMVILLLNTYREGPNLLIAVGDTTDPSVSGRECRGIGSAAWLSPDVVMGGDVRCAWRSY
jgi:hypothetical protein